MANQPTDKMLDLARRIAAAVNVPLGGAEHDFHLCSEFITQHKKRFYELEEARRKAHPLAPPEAPARRLTKPTRKQVDTATNLFAQLREEAPSPHLAAEHAKALESGISCSQYITNAIERLDAVRRDVRALQTELNKLSVIPGPLRAELRAASTAAARLDILAKRNAAARPALARSPLSPTRLEALVDYWAEAISRTAFAGFASAKNLLGGSEDGSFTLQEVACALDELELPKLDLQAEQPLVRHLVVRLGLGRKGQDGQLQREALCVLPIQAYPSTKKRGYDWGGAQNELPRFNRKLLGEDAEIEGLGLEDADALDEHLEAEASKFQPWNEKQPKRPLEDAWADLDRCFERLTGSHVDGAVGLAGWIGVLRARHAHFKHLKKAEVDFTLVSGMSVTGPTVHVASTLKQLKEDPDELAGSPLGLFRQVAGLAPTQAVPFDHQVESVELDHILGYSGHMDSRKMDAREAYPLDPAQRDAILALQMLDDGQVLAVNGPPGTGKTSLLRAVIASTWIAPLLRETEDLPEAPLILASAATNQAVTNIISSFDETPGPTLFDDRGQLLDGVPVTIESRWLPWLCSYGWYAPAGRATGDSSEQGGTRYDRYHQIRRDWVSDPWQVQGACAGFQDLAPEDAKQHFERCASTYLGAESTLLDALAKLRARLLAEQVCIQSIHAKSKTWLEQMTLLAGTNHWGPKQDAEFQRLETQARLLEYGAKGLEGLGQDIVRLTATAERLKVAVPLAARSMAVVSDLQLMEQSPTSPLVLELRLLASADKHLSDVQQRIQSRLSANFLHRLWERGREFVNAQAVEAERTDLMRAITEAGVRLSAGGEGDLTAVHTAVTHRRQQLQQSMARLALMLVTQEVLGEEAPGPEEATGAWLSLRLHGHLVAVQTELGAAKAARAALQRELQVLQAEMEQQAKRRSAFHAREKAARLALHDLRGVLDRPGAPADLAAQTNELLDKTLAELVAGRPMTVADHTRVLVKLLQDRLDRHERLQMFHLAARWWEGRYVDEAVRQQERKAANRSYRPTSAQALRHLAMLGPVFVATAASTPKLMKRYVAAASPGDSPYLFGEADLLIVDEAGQATPEGNITSFAFAKRAIVVGDVEQLSPVWSTDPAADDQLVKRFELERFTTMLPNPGAALTASGLLVSSGSIMLAAQNATAVTVPGAAQRGVTLTNHYRCLEPIIAICNRMVYKGALTCATPTPKSLWQPQLSRLAYLLVEETGNTKQPGGSRANEAEARLIARWLFENRNSLLAHFAPAGDNDLADIVGIVTPYKAQTTKLRQHIAAQFDEPIGALRAGETETRLHRRMTIGTVHSLQGAEKDIVIFAMVDTETPAEPQFFDRRHDLVNVAVSRAKHMLIATLSRAAVRYGSALSDKVMAEGTHKPSDYLIQAMVHHGSRLNPQKVVVVESPNKRERIHQALGGRLDTAVLATGGHVRQLQAPDKWDAGTAEAPAWGPVSDQGRRMMLELVFLWSGLQELYLATDPDAEGETIAWHCLDMLGAAVGGLDVQGTAGKRPRVRRMRFNTLRDEDIRAAQTDAGDGLDAGLIKSALARSFLDFLIASRLPLKLGLVKQPQFQAGVGRVQMGILDLVAQRARAPGWYEVSMSLPWQGGLVAAVQGAGDDPNRAPARFSSYGEAQALAVALQAAAAEPDAYWTLSTHSRFEQVPGLPTLNTARYLAMAYRSSGARPSQTMDLLQHLYEGGTGAGTAPAEDDHG